MRISPTIEKALSVRIQSRTCRWGVVVVVGDDDRTNTIVLRLENRTVAGGFSIIRHACGGPPGVNGKVMAVESNAVGEG